MKTTITLIIPCYNVEKYIDRCMESVEAQTLGIDFFQIILIDDASTDNTYNKLLTWKTKYPEHIQLIKHDINRRQGTCRNEGIKLAVGEYIAFLDADDWVEEDMYERLYEVAEFGECDVVHCRNAVNTTYEYNKGLEERYTDNKDRLILIENNNDRGQMIASNLLGTYVVTKLYRKCFIEENEIYFPENVVYEDIFWMGLLNCYACKIGIIEERLYHYFMNMTSISRARNNTHGRDIIEVNRLLWDEYNHRQLMDASMYGELGEALRYEMLCTYYLTATKMMLLRYDDIPYDMFYEVQSDMLDMIPDYSFNKYINEYTTEFNILLLGLLDKELTHEDIDSVAECMRMITNKGKQRGYDIWSHNYQ